MASHWARWMIVERKGFSLNLICFKLPRKLDVRSLQRQTLPRWSEFLVCAVWTTATWVFCYYSLEQHSARDLGIHWDLPQDLEWTIYPWGQYYLVHCSVRCDAQDLSNLGVLCLPSWMELWKINHQTPHDIELRHDQLLGLELELLILHKMVSDQERSLHISEVPTWEF